MSFLCQICYINYGFVFINVLHVHWRHMCGSHVPWTKQCTACDKRYYYLFFWCCCWLSSYFWEYCRPWACYSCHFCLPPTSMVFSNDEVYGPINLLGSLLWSTSPRFNWNNVLESRNCFLWSTYFQLKAHQPNADLAILCFPSPPYQ